MRIGAATIDITPDSPIRLCGYAVRDRESEGIDQRIRATAIAFVSHDSSPAILISIESTLITHELTETVAGRLQERAGIPRDRVALCCTHTHYAPCIDGGLINLFDQDLPDDQLKRIRDYTRELTDRLEWVALDALGKTQTATLGLRHGRVTFAANRRTEGGPADHTLSLLSAHNDQRELIAGIVGYTCHCTTPHTVNMITGDWAGYAREAIESGNPGTHALVLIGCASDINPHPRGDLALARHYGADIAAEVNRMTREPGVAIEGDVGCSIDRFPLPFDRLPGPEEWRSRLAAGGHEARRARMYLDRLQRGETISDTLPYTIQTWSFGTDLAMVFLAGEVVVDYQLRLQREYGRDRLWITAYANDVPCYIPSVRILNEGGYEAEESMIYYAQPVRLAAATEEIVCRNVHIALQQHGFEPLTRRHEDTGHE